MTKSITTKEINAITKSHIDITGSFIIINMEQHLFKDSNMEKKPGDYYIRLLLQDNTGQTDAIIWDGNDFHWLELGQIIKIKGKINIRQKVQINIYYAEEDIYADPSLFIPKSPRNLESMKKQLKTIINNMDNGFYKSLIKLALNKPLIKKGFYEAPAGKRNHHAYLHGLLEHTINIMQGSTLLAKHYNTLYKEKINHNLLIAGAFFHDFGKIWEYDWSKGRIEIVNRFNGHIHLACKFIKELIEHKSLSSHKNRKNHYYSLLTHIVESHHGPDFSNIKPGIICAWIIFHLDFLDSRVGAAQASLREMKTQNLDKIYNPFLGNFILNTNFPEDKKRIQKKKTKINMELGKEVNGALFKN